MRKLSVMLASAATAVCLFAATAQAAPANTSLPGLKVLGQQSTLVEQARWGCRRHCWWHRGHYHCRRVCRHW